MAFIFNIDEDPQNELSESVLACLADHTRIRMKPIIMQGTGSSPAVAAVPPSRMKTFKDGITIVLSGRPRFRDIDEDYGNDLEIIYSLYRKKDQEFITRMWGSIAIVISDVKQNRCLLYRDRLGFVPLFYSLKNKVLWVSDSIKPIIASRHVSFSIDIDAVYRYLYLKAFESPDTPIREIRSVPPGCSLLKENGKLSIDTYWDLPMYFGSVEKIGKNTEGELKDLLADCLVDSVGHSKRPNTFFLSGGVDSAVLAALACQRGIKCSSAVNVSFNEPWQYLDESGYAEKVAESCSIPLKKTSLDFKGLLNSLPTLFWNNNLPTANSGFKLNLVGTHNFGEKAHETFVFGLGADTMLSYGWKWKHFEKLERLSFLGSFLPESMRIDFLAMLERCLSGIQRGSMSNQYTGMLASYYGALLGYNNWKGSIFRPEEVTNLFVEQNKKKPDFKLISEVFRKYYSNASPATLAEQLIYVSLKSYTPNQQLMNYHTTSNYFGAELACPYLDERVIQFCLRLPISTRVEKTILKELAEKLFPREVVYRKKGAFLMPMESWIKGPLMPLVEETFSKINLIKRGFLNTTEMTILLDRFKQGSFTSWPDIWSFVLLEAWLRMNFDTTPPMRIKDLCEIFPKAGILPEEN